jgi:hypothetical protein
MTDLDRLSARIESLYGERSHLPNVPPVYVVEPPATPRHSEIDEARALVVAFLRELPDVALTLTAFTVILVRDAWRWLRQWKRTKGG